MRLRISSIDSSLNKVKLQELFEEFGDVSSVKLFRSMDGTPALGFIEMKRERDAQAALSELNGTRIGASVLKVEVSSDVFRTNHTAVAVPPAADDDEEDEEEDDLDLDEENIDLPEGEEEDEEEEDREVPLDALDDDEYDEPSDEDED